MLRLLTLLIFAISTTDQKQHSVTKRYVLFPQYSVLQFTYGLSIPLILPSRSINLSWCVQCNYDLPWNLTNFEPLYGRSSDNFDMTRSKFYKHIIGLLESFGLNGEDCLLRSVCEISEIPMHLEDGNALLERVVHYVFTPSADSHKFLGNDSIMHKVSVAEHLGRMHGGCSIAFDGCAFSLVDIFTNKFGF